MVERRAEQGSQLRAGAGVAQGQEHRQGVDPFGEVLAGGLAELLVGGDHVEDVVAELEEHAEAASEVREDVDFGAGEPAGERADATRRGHERGGLALDGPEVVVLGAFGAEGRADLGDLSLAQQAQRVGEEPGDLGAERRGDLGRAGQEEVAGHDGDEVAEAGVDALHVAAHQGLVHDVVVVERGQVDELDGHRPLEVVGGRRPATSGGRGQGQAGPQALAPGRDQVGGDLVEEGVARADGVPELGFQPSRGRLGGRGVTAVRRCPPGGTIGEGPEVGTTGGRRDGCGQGLGPDPAPLRPRCLQRFVGAR